VSWPVIELASAMESAEVFVDGDWVESKDQDPEGDVRLIQLADIGDGVYLNKSSRFLTESKARQLKCTYLKEGDVLVARMPDPLGRACIFPGDHRPAVTVVDVCVIRPSVKSHDPRWLMHTLNTPSTRRQITAFASGTTRSRISRSNLGKVKIPNPPLAEQRRIAELLDRAEVLGAKRRAGLTQLDTLTQSIFLDLFGDPAANPKGLQLDSLGNHLLFVTSGSRGWAEFYAPTGKRFIRSLDVQMNHIGSDDLAFVIPPDNAEARRTRVMTEDVLLTITGSRIGRVAPVPEKLSGAYISQHVAILRVDQKRIEPTFLSFFLSFEAGGQRQIAKAQYGQTKPGLNFEQIRRFQVPVPPLSLQHDFARRVAAVEKLKGTYRTSLAKLDALFETLQYHALQGDMVGAHPVRSIGKAFGNGEGV
jgi:type I restriction enzyme S subunit